MRISIVSGKRIDDVDVVKPDEPNELVEQAERTLTMVKTHGEAVAGVCRDDCATLVREVTDTLGKVVDLVKRKTAERPLGNLTH